MAETTRSYCTAEQRAVALKRHLVDKVPVSQLCAELNVSVGAFYNEVRLHSALGYITPQDQVEGRAEYIHLQRNRKLAAAREQRAAHRRKLANQAAPTTTTTTLAGCLDEALGVVGAR